jgi:hypothetical protein
VAVDHSTEERIDRLERSVADALRRCGIVESALTEMLTEIRPILADAAYAKRRRDDRHKAEVRSWLALKVCVSVIVGVPIFVESIVQLWPR